MFNGIRCKKNKENKKKKRRKKYDITKIECRGVAERGKKKHAAIPQIWKDQIN